MAEALSVSVDPVESTVVDINYRQLVGGYTTSGAQLLLQVTDVTTLGDFQLVLESGGGGGRGD